MSVAYIALGSNLENPIQQVRQGIAAIDQIEGVSVIAQSPLYQTAPDGYTEEDKASIPDFINAVISVETSLAPEELLKAILSIEEAAGRTRPYHYAPRILDCDLLMYESVTMQTEFLTLPHPRMHERGFVLLPLFDVAPTLLIPNHGKIGPLITPTIALGVQQLSLK